MDAGPSVIPGPGLQQVRSEGQARPTAQQRLCRE